MMRRLRFSGDEHRASRDYSVQMPTGPQSLSGLARWLRAAAALDKPVTISPETARILADAADSQSNALMQGKAA